MGADAATLGEIAGILIAVLGGKEGIRIVVGKLRNNKQEYVTEKFCASKHGEVQKDIEELKRNQHDMAGDVKEILKRMTWNCM